MQRSLATTSVGSLLLAGMVMLGCGDAPEADKFIGVWEYDLSSASRTCVVGTNASQDGIFDHVQKEFFAGVTSDLVDTSPADLAPTFPCNYKYKVAAGVATIVPGQSCAIIDTSVPTLDQIGTETPVTGTFGLRGDGTELQQDSSMTDVLMDGSFNCTITIQGHLKKIAKN